MNKDKVSNAALYCVIQNMTVVALFGILAYHFDKWWIILFSVLVQCSLTTKPGNVQHDNTRSQIIRCDACGEMLFVLVLEDAVLIVMKYKHCRRI